MSNANDNYVAKSAKTLTPAGEVVIPVDEVTGGHKVITTDHSFIHAGIAYTSAGKFDVASAKVAAIGFATAADSYVHFKPTHVSTSAGPIIVSLMEDYTFTGNTSTLPAINRKRTGTVRASTSTVTFSADATAVNGGAAVTMATMNLSGATTGAKVGSSADSAEEWVLKPDTHYILTFTNATSPGATVTVSYDLFWYEEAAG